MTKIEKLNKAKSLCHTIITDITENQSNSISKSQIQNAQILVNIMNTDLDYPEFKTFFLSKNTTSPSAISELFTIDKFINDQIDKITEIKQYLSSAINLSNKILSEIQRNTRPENKQNDLINDLINKAFISSVTSTRISSETMKNILNKENLSTKNSDKTSIIIDDIYKLKYIIDVKLNNIINTDDISNIIKENREDAQKSETIRYNIIKIRELLIEKEQQYNTVTSKHNDIHEIRPYLYKYNYQPLTREQALRWYEQLETYGHIYDALPYISIIEKIINDPEYAEADTLVNQTIKDLWATDNLHALVYYIMANVTLNGFTLTMTDDI